MREDEREEDEERWTRHQERTFEKPAHDTLIKAIKNFNGFTRLLN